MEPDEPWEGDLETFGEFDRECLVVGEALRRLSAKRRSVVFSVNPVLSSSFWLRLATRLAARPGVVAPGLLSGLFSSLPGLGDLLDCGEPALVAPPAVAARLRDEEPADIAFTGPLSVLRALRGDLEGCDFPSPDSPIVFAILLGAEGEL